MPANVVAYKWALEVGKAGNLHTHTFVCLSRSWRLSGLRKKYIGVDVKLVTAGTEATVIDYIGSTDKEVTKGCSVLAVSCFGNLDATQGFRNDMTATDAVLWQVKDAIDAGATTHDLYNTFFPYLVKYGKGLLAYKHLRNSNGARPDAPSFIRAESLGSPQAGVLQDENSA